MKLLKDILYKVSVNTIYGDTNLEISQIDFDSRAVKEGSLFVAQKGVSVDGHLFIDKAIQLGATSVICEVLPEKKQDNITFIQVDDSNTSLAIIASNFYDNPSSKLKLIGVTGTNGKTTIASLLYQLHKKAGFKVGLLSTVQILVDTIAYESTHTTPDSVTINNYLNQMVVQGVTHCFMEVSSHGIHQKRTAGLDFSGGIFTNLSHDHLDYHNSFASYRDVKKIFFDALPKTAFALTNLDDKNGAVMLQNTKAKKRTYALKTLADYKAKIIEKSFSGTLLSINGVEVWTKLIGNFNAYNLAAIIGTAYELGMDKLEALTIVSQLESVSGRFEHFVTDTGVIAIVDYAHTPDALKNVLETINDIRKATEKLITVVGCGGNRDKTKRPKMAHIASQLSTQSIFTSDNPRTENPETILEEMELGVSEENLIKTITISDRRQAIKTACKFSEAGDILLIAGKGHENYQEINGEQFYFDDLVEVKKYFNLLKK
ncbi:UDP-N-acetylmuramoyl-L-alanyl-D-glutamate--2,6-diaminopimelate ligase [Flavobacteriaceae bacterium]|nr:UDP-N-acetylmuramoyl-L-alanyl-D-glutamate--2,6-diaminopimelate ligase [Flavobacteriaceae bacterium]MDB2491141.1 UDP-N-acetylmuramoyl-L-alanyl-D-glutamate--2,6-diaminopimelate ligase [Flavobacteriaceae bacterium]MDB2625467.1 UDP-N-acetylmuramoyl-L-alanyl-D-glutamate--2,6-diaminopimelate ligase [Flavobacteriaceae bacterium]MDB2657744.1 UDP-N-acetylmuramoyl-L-alanyl-D-glutamate--2,6-diaminopimelate ligase [Flavobacteriaceae bacterium]MDG1980209.1 UDP-N-acetylmuramoyl-L-alanyl-D-glutamate--2,6-d